MIGVIIGDVAGSKYEFHNKKTKDFELFDDNSFATDESVMSLAVTNAILKSKSKIDKLEKNVVLCMKEFGNYYPYAGYGGMFNSWLKSQSSEPYNSFGNGAAVRVGSCAYVSDSLSDALEMSDIITNTTHNHPDSVKAARSVVESIYMAIHGSNMLEIEEMIKSKYYPLGFSLDSIRDNYEFDVSCEGSVPQALEAFLESTSFEDAVRNAVSIGGDSDTIAAITASIAEAYYGVPVELRNKTLIYLDEKQLKVLNDFECKYGYFVSRNIAGSNKKIKINPGNVKKTTTERDRAYIIAGSSIKNEKKMTSQQMFNHLYKACDILRGPINQDDYKTYIIPLLFFKRVSDVYDEETKIGMEKYGDDFDFFEEELHKFVIPEGCHWDDVREKVEDIGEAIIHSMMEIERANPNSLGGLFSSFDDASWTDKNKLSDERLKELVEHMSGINVGNNDYTADIMGDAYEYLLKKFADLSKKNAGEVYTPRTIVRLCAMLLDPQPGNTVYDGACGTGGMLIESIRHIQEKGSALDTYGKIYAQEKNLSTSAIARMNLFLHGASDFKIVQGDTLRSPGFTEGNKLKTFDRVIMNPPFSLKNWGREQFETDQFGRNLWGTPGEVADFAWLQHVVSSMDEKTGKGAVILPQGVLFHGGKEGVIRSKLVKSDKIEAIINLAGGLFYGAGVAACIIFLNNNKSKERKGKMILVDATNICTPVRAQNTMTEDDIKRVYSLYSDWKDVVDYAKVVSVDDVNDKNGELSVNLYINKTVAPTIDIAHAKKNYLKAIKEAEIAEEKLMKLLKDGGWINE